MILYELKENHSTVETNQKLYDFEKLFDYPLGENKRFRIDHGPDYTAFYRSMGLSKTIIAESNGIMIAAISAVIRNIRVKNVDKKIVYIGDLKIHPSFRSGRILFKLAKHLEMVLSSSDLHAYGIVMDGTPLTPENYSGRAGIPLFQPLAKVCILRFKTSYFPETVNSEKPKTVNSEKPIITPNDSGYILYRRLNRRLNHRSNPRLNRSLNRSLHSNAILLELSNSNLRSSLDPLWFHWEDTACAMLEDTRKAKKLVLTTGEELLSAHLSYFTFVDPMSAENVLKQAITYAYGKGYPAVFVALSEYQCDLLKEQLKNFSYDNHSATLYATNSICANITINTAEI